MAFLVFYSMACSSQSPWLCTAVFFHCFKCPFYFYYYLYYLPRANLTLIFTSAIWFSLLIFLAYPEKLTQTYPIVDRCYGFWLCLSLLLARYLFLDLILRISSLTKLILFSVLQENFLLLLCHLRISDVSVSFKAIESFFLVHER